MSTKRESYTETQHLVLYEETNGLCPRCANPILSKKVGKKTPTKGYELAHIYPLNPSPAQKAALIGVVPPADINALENLIALCPSCHTKYDKDFLIAEYETLFEIKKKFLQHTEIKATISGYQLEEEVFQILDEIVQIDGDIDVSAEQTYKPSTVDDKVGDGMVPVRKREIKRQVAEYYIRIRDHIRILEEENQTSVQLFQQQVKTYYLKMEKTTPGDKEQIYDSIASWIHAKSNKSLDACRILTSFFIQNCEVFDVNT